MAVRAGMEQLRPMRLLQLSDPHLLADPHGLCRGRQPLPLLRHGLNEALNQLHQQGESADLLLISGDLCHDESWQGYGQLRAVLRQLAMPVALLPGNHDDTTLLRAALGRHAALAPALLPCGDGEVLLLDSHRPGALAGWLGQQQLLWVRRVLAQRCPRPLLVAVHHPPLPIGDPSFDAIALQDGAALLALLQPLSDLRALLFGHVHQHWQGVLPGRPEVAVLGCPSTLSASAPVQPCPLGRPADPGGRLLRLEPDGELHQELLRWSACRPPSVSSVGQVPDAVGR